jgi:hypothetical protein
LHFNPRLASAIGRRLPPLASLHFPYVAPADPEWTAYAIAAQEAFSIWRRAAMADLVYVVLGLAFFALMTLYAAACDRL